jgi:MFS family permease
MTRVSAGRLKEGPYENGDVRRLTGRAAWFLALMTFGYFAFTADRTVLSSVLKPLSAAVGAGVSILGVAGTAWLASAQFIGVLAFVLVSGYLSDRYGHRRVILCGVGVFTAFTWLIGLSQNFTEAFVFRLVSGFVEGLFWPAAMSAVANYFGRDRGLSLGIFYAGFDLGGAAGNLIGSTTFALTSDWRTAFYVAPLLGLPVLAGLSLSGKDFEKAKSEGGAGSLRSGALLVLERNRTKALMAFAFLATWASVWQVAYLPYYYSDVLGASVPEAGVVAAGVLAAGLVGKVAVGRISDRLRRDRVLVGLSVVVVALYLLFFSTSDFPLGVGTALAMGFFSGAIFPVMQALAADSARGKTGTALGLTTTFQSMAAVVGTILPGSLFSLGVGRAIALDAMVPAALMALVALWLRDSRAQPGGPPTVYSGPGSF